MANVMSFVLYGTHPRYWGAIPFNVVAYESYHPNFDLLYHLHKETTEVELFPMFEELEKRGMVKFKVIDRPYVNTEPTTWRMMPLWEKDCPEYVFCRDLDAVPTTEERQAVCKFMEKGLIVHGIRSYVLHTTTLMAGLCGFNTIALRNCTPLLNSFEDYVGWGRKNLDYCHEWIWGCDQHLLNGYFYSRTPWLAGHTLDTMLGSATPMSGWGAQHLPKSEYDKVDTSHVNPAIRHVCDNMVPFLASPNTSVTHEHLKVALQQNTEKGKVLKDIFTKYPKIKEYYRAEW